MPIKNQEAGMYVLWAMEQTQWIDRLDVLNKKHSAQLAELQNASQDKLIARPATGGWNVLECIAHLSAYSDFYLNEFERVISSGKPHSGKPFKSGMMGGRSAQSMLPAEDGKPKNPMKTFKKMNMEGRVTERSVLLTFKAQCDTLDALLVKAKSVDLNKNRCKLTLPLITFNLGDTLAFHVFHNERHMKQALRAFQEK